MTNATQRLEKIIEIANARATRIADAATPKSNYNEIQRKLTKDYKAIQRYALRNGLGQNDSYTVYCFEAMDKMDTIYDKIKGVQTK